MARTVVEEPSGSALCSHPDKCVALSGNERLPQVEQDPPCFSWSASRPSEGFSHGHPAIEPAAAFQAPCHPAPDQNHASMLAAPRLSVQQGLARMLSRIDAMCPLGQAAKAMSAASLLSCVPADSRKFLLSCRWCGMHGQLDPLHLHDGGDDDDYDDHGDDDGDDHHDDAHDDHDGGGDADGDGVS
mmetsp:Transcript_23933/g.43929  ORF Transcript_23933/g.43929 Transcript_23933/m.43929 type:complete len:186 (-) Transcript_23933:694-1251(-)